MKKTELDEQDVCVNCGFCCDHTLFDVARLNDQAPFEKFKDIETIIKGKSYFKLPCPYFDSKCTIYNQKKPSVCTEYKCKIIRKMTGGDLSKNETLKIVKDTKKLRDDIVGSYNAITNKNLTFRQIFVLSFKDNAFETDPELRSLKMKTQVLDILLTKHFKGDEHLSEFYEIID